LKRRGVEPSITPGSDIINMYAGASPACAGGRRGCFRRDARLQADLGALQAGLISYLDNGLKDILTEKGGNPRPTAAFERVGQRAISHAQELGRPAVTGANTLLALFPETRSPAARLLGEQGVSEERTADFMPTASTRQPVSQPVPVAATMKQGFDAATSDGTHAAISFDPPDGVGGLFAAGASFAADLKIPPRTAPEDVLGAQGAAELQPVDG